MEELRVDVSQRRCKVVPSEIHVLSESVAMLSRGLLELQSRFWEGGRDGLQEGGEEGGKEEGREGGGEGGGDRREKYVHTSSNLNTSCGVHCGRQFSVIVKDSLS